jgi:general secretion pathway protein N
MAVVRVIPLLGIMFVTLCALTATASAGPIVELARPAPEVESAPTMEASEAAARPSGAPRAVDPDARSRPGNPLWSVPLRALSATRDRPLFSISRRPPVVPVPVVAPPPEKEAVASPPPERPLLMLVGTIVGPKATLAMLQSPNTDTVLRLRVGQENDGWQVRGISLRSIIVEKGARSVELGLPKPNGAPAE